MRRWASSVGRGAARVCDVGAFGVGEEWIVAGVAVDLGEEQEVEQADDAGGGEAPAPADFEEEDADEGHADGRGELGCGVEDGGGEAALAGGEPEADGLGVRGEGGRFADAEQEACGERACRRWCNGGGEGGDAPDGGADAADAAYAEAIEQDADGKLADGVGPVVGAGEIAEGDVGDAEGGVERGVGDGEVDAVEVVDQHAGAEEPGNAPPALWRPVAGGRSGRNMQPWRSVLRRRGSSHRQGITLALYSRMGTQWKVSGVLENRCSRANARTGRASR